MLKFARHLALFAALAVAVSACTQQPDPKVAQLEKELKDMKDQLAASKDAQAGAAAGQAAATTAATAATDAATAAQQTAAAAEKNAAAAQQTVAAQAEQANRDRAATEKTLADQSRALADQKAAAERTAQENQRLQRELEEMKPREFTLPAGTIIPVRTTAELSTSRLKNGSVFDALLEKDLISGGTVLAKAGATVTCIVTSSDPGGRIKGVASLSVAARSIAGVGGNPIAIKTDSYSQEAGSTKKRDAVRTGIATGVGAVVGGIAGGGKGAAIGAGAGAAAGVGANAATRGEAAVIPTETLIEFALSAPATVVLRK
jgi:hypothetical protein